MEANPGEPVNVFVKLYPCLEKLRSTFASRYDDSQAFQNLEQVVMKLPNAKERLAERVEEFNEARARWQLQNKKRGHEASAAIKLNAIIVTRCRMISFGLGDITGSPK